MRRRLYRKLEQAEKSISDRHDYLKEISERLWMARNQADKGELVGPALISFAADLRRLAKAPPMPNLKRLAAYVETTARKLAASGESNQPKPRMTARHGLIRAAVCGLAGDSPSPMYCPATEDTIISWAQSHTGRNAGDFHPEFKKLVTERLFLEVQRGVFDPPVYCCSYDAKFLKLIGADEVVSQWKEILESYNETFGKGWRKSGICMGQGFQTDEFWGPCLGRACHSGGCCRYELEFAEEKQRKRRS